MPETEDKIEPRWHQMRPRGFTDERDFVDALKARRLAAWEELHRLYDEEIRFFVWRANKGCSDDLDDLVQDVYARLPRALRNFRHHCPLHYFVRKVTTDCCTDEIRRHIKRRGLFCSLVQRPGEEEEYNLQIEDTKQESSYQAVARNEMKRALSKAIRTITEMCREVIELRYFQHMAYDTIAEKLGLSINTIGSRLRKCMDKMRGELLAYQ